jgi:hypothetical protein
MKVHYRFEIVQGVGVTVCQTFAITVMVILVIEQVCMIRLSNISDQIALQIQRLTRFLNTVYVDNQWWNETVFKMLMLSPVIIN